MRVAAATACPLSNRPGVARMKRTERENRQVAKILLAEDDEALCALYEAWLVEAGHEVTAVRDGAAALERLRDEPFEAVVLDIVLPAVDGVEVTRQAQALRPGAKVIAISGGGAHLSPGLAVDLSAMFGASAVLTKPFAERELLAAVDRVTI